MERWRPASWAGCEVLFRADQTGVLVQRLAERLDGRLVFRHVGGPGFQDDPANLIEGQGVFMIQIAENHEQVGLGAVELAEIFQGQGQAITGFDIDGVELNRQAEII